MVWHEISTPISFNHGSTEYYFPLFTCNLYVVVIRSLSCIWLFVTPWTLAHQASRSFTIPRSLLKLMSIELVMPSSHLILWHPLLLLPFHLSEHQGLFQWASFSHQVAKIVELQHQSFQWYSGLISFRMDWFDLLSIQGTLNCLLQHHRLFGIQLSLWSSSHIHTWLLEKPQLWVYRSLLAKWCLCFLMYCLVLS